MARIAVTSRSAAIETCSTSAPIRSARILIWFSDSSPDTMRAVPPSAAATSSTNVDLPTPGSPATRVTEPATMPPPSTRSNSSMPVARRCPPAAGATSVIAIGRVSVEWVVCSLSVPVVRHWGQNPIQRAVVYSHVVHRYDVMQTRYGVGVTGMSHKTQVARRKSQDASRKTQDARQYEVAQPRRVAA